MSPKRAVARVGAKPAHPIPKAAAAAGAVPSHSAATDAEDDARSKQERRCPPR
jgi:hypothetical protein